MGLFFGTDGLRGKVNEELTFDIAYKIYCIDVDGFNKGEDPFGYGIRADGKILNGKRAEEWQIKTLQKN